jgi:hypothetical protein
MGSEVFITMRDVFEIFRIFALDLVEVKQYVFRTFFGENSGPDLLGFSL